MAVTIDGTTGISAVQDGTVTATDLTNTLDLTGKDVTLPAGVGGKVLQVVQGVFSSPSSTGGTSFADTGLSASITPSNTSSKILVMVNQPLSIYTNQTSPRDIAFNIVRESTMITIGFGEMDTDTNAGVRTSSGNYLIYLDSPSTTSLTTYKTQFKLNGTAADVFAQQHGTESTITLMEIAE